MSDQSVKSSAQSSSGKFTFSQRFALFPITSFAIILGLGALAIIFDKWHHLQWIPELPYTITMVLVTFLFFLFLSLYGYKAIVAPEEVRKDFRHPVRLNFFPAIPISVLILSLIYMGRFPIASLSFWYVGTIGEMIFAFVIIDRWFSKEIDIKHYNPAWFIPVVGIVLIPVAGVSYVPNVLMMFFWAPAILLWMVLLTIIFYRIIFHTPLPSKLAPTFFMLVAPPAVGFIAYVRIERQIDHVALSMLAIAVFFMLVLLFMNKSFRKIPFFLSWWAFTFPLSAFTIAWTVAYLVTRQIVFAVPAWAFGGITIIVDVIVIWNTIKNIRRGNICVEED